MKDSRGTIEIDEADIENNIALNEEDINGSSTLVINDSALSMNGEDSRDSCNQLSIDTGVDIDTTESVQTKPSIRIAKGLTKDNNENLAQVSAPLGILAAQLTSGIKRKQISNPVQNISNGNGVPGMPLVKKSRPNATENDLEIVGLEKEIRALQWLARRKEQEWDRVISLLKQKEEKLLRAQRNKVMIQVEAEHLLAKFKPTPSPVSSLSTTATGTPTTVVLPQQIQPLIVPQQQVLIIPTSIAASPAAITSTNRLIQPKPSATAATLVTKSGNTQSKSPSPTKTTHANGVNNELTNQEQKFSSAIEKATVNLQKAASGGNATAASNNKEDPKKNTPVCQGCGKKKSEFVCAGCSNRWYCSRECQVEDWDEHADECSG